MKLRIRSLETRETQRIEVPNPCSLQRLKQLLSVSFSSSLSPPPPDSIHLSLNRKDEIQSPSPDEQGSLQSLGITSGDLLFFTFSPTGFSPQTQIPNPHKPTSNMTKNPEIPSSSDLNLAAEASDLPKNSNMEAESEELMEDDMEVDAIDDVSSCYSAPSFLKKVFTAELGGTGDDGSNHKLLVVAIHAVLLESGFVGFDMDLKTEIKGFQFRNNWPSNMFMLSLFYTLPGIIGQVFTNADYQNGVVVLKFQSTGNVVNVYGSLCSASTHTYSVRLNEECLVPFLNVAWANCGLREKIASKDGISFTSPGIEVFSFWKKVKDELALPLLMDLCERAGLVLPPCFMRLPVDLKLKILESLPGADIAKVSCVCSELRYLASNDDLWKLKFVEEFGDAGTSDERGNWKGKFAARWQSRKKRRAALRFQMGHPRRMILNPGTRLLPRRPGIIGGDYDLWPQNFPPFYQAGLHPSRNISRSHIPPCNRNRNV